MNSLSWMLYLAELAENIGVAARIFAFVSAFFGLSIIFFAEQVTKTAVYFGVIFVINMFIGVIIPSKTTVYMIVASEAGEVVVTSPEAQEMLNDLQEIIRRELKGKLGETRT